MTALLQTIRAAISDTKPPTPTCAVSPGVSSSDEDKIKNTVTGGGGAEGPVTVALNLQEHQDSSWLDVDQIHDSDLRFEDRAAKDKCQKLGDLENNLRSDGAKDGQAEDGSREIDHHANLAENGPEDEDGVEHGGEDAITDPEMDGIEVYGDGSHSKGGHRAGFGGDAEGWCYPRPFFVLELTLQFQESRTRPTPKSLKLQCTPHLPPWPVEVVVDLVAAELRLRWVTPSGRSLRSPEMNNRAKGGSSRSKPRHGWLRKISQFSGAPSQHIGPSRAAQGVKGRAYVGGKAGALAERGKNVKP